MKYERAQMNVVAVNFRFLLCQGDVANLVELSVCLTALPLTNNNYSHSLPFVSFSGWYGEEKYFGIENDFKIIVLKDRKTLIK